LAVDGCTPIIALQFARDLELEIEKKKEIEREREKYKETHISCLGEREAVCKRVLCDVLIYLQSYTTLLQSSA
jgi:hypothetical protein